MSNFILHTDGGSRGNPGPAACGFSLEENGVITVSGGWYLGCTTNNQAEYCALIWGLQNAIELGVKSLIVQADSELMVKQMNGEYKVKNAKLKPLFMNAQRLAKSFDFFKIEHVYREHNVEADALANEAMDVKSAVGTFKVSFDTAASLIASKSGQNSLF